MSPVVRTPSLNGIDAIAVLREQHMVPYDVPGAYLQGVQTETEQIVLRPPRELRTWDERGVEIMWLMLVPVYSQADSGAIWNRTVNDFATSESPASCEFGRCPQEPCVYSKAPTATCRAWPCLSTWTTAGSTRTRPPRPTLS